MKNIHDVIEQIESGRCTAKELTICPYNIGKNYVWHPLGFLMSKLFEEPSLALRVHIWPKGGGREQNPAWPIHDHIFNMKSWILQGSIINTVYCASEKSSNFQQYLASYLGNESILTRTEQEISLARKCEETYGAGQFYTMDAGIFHSSSHAKENTTVTAVLTNNVFPGPPRIAGSKNGLHEYRYARSIASKEEVLNIISEI